MCKALGTAIRIAVIVVGASSTIPAQAPVAGRPLSLEDLFSPSQLDKYKKKTKYQDRIDIYHGALDSLASRMRDHLKKKELAKVEEYLSKIRALAQNARQEPARESASNKDLRAKQVRKFEIRIRKLVSTLNSDKLSVPFDFREGFELAARDLEELRNQLLIQIFGEAAAPRNPPPLPW